LHTSLRPKSPSSMLPRDGPLEWNRGTSRRHQWRSGVSLLLYYVHKDATAKPQKAAIADERSRLEPLAEVQRALLVVEVLKAPDPQLLGLGVGNGLEHF
jgi:hypothetical protein